MGGPSEGFIFAVFHTPAGRLWNESTWSPADKNKIDVCVRDEPVYSCLMYLLLLS